MKLEESYYQYGKSIGIDYNYYGNWQKEYAKLIVSISNILPIVANYQKSSVILDIGTACGVNLKAFKELRVFKNHIGIDSDEYMIELGKKTHGFNDDELITLDITKEELPLEDNSVHFIHCSQVLEHIKEADIDIIFEELSRVLKENGSLIINVPLLKGKNQTNVKEDIKHINIQTYVWWRKKLLKHFKGIDTEINTRFQEDKHTPNKTKNTFYDFYNQTWNFFQVFNSRRS